MSDVVEHRGSTQDAHPSMGGHFIVSGDDALANAIIEELEGAGVRIVRLTDDDVADTQTDLAEARIADAAAIVCAGDDDVTNLEIAVLARKANPEVRVVARVANDVLREALGADNGPGAILDVAELAAPSIVEACLAQPTHPFAAAGIEFLVSGNEAPRDGTLRELYGDLAPVAVIRGLNSPTPGEVVICPRRTLAIRAGDWTAMIGTADELAAGGIKIPRPTVRRGRRRPLRRVLDAVRVVANDVNPVFYAVVAALLILVSGSMALLHFSYRPSGKLTWIDSLYFTAETITTTGYGDFSFASQATWLRLFAAMLMLGGVTTTALLVAFIADVLLSRRFIYSGGRPRVRHLRNHVVVVGLGTLGFRVVTDLLTAGYDVAVVDIDEDNRFLPAAAKFDIPVIFGDATLRQTLESVRVHRARAVAVMTRDEVVNIETGIVLAEMLGRRLTSHIVRPTVPLVLRVYDRTLGFAVARRFGFVNTRSTVELAAPWFISAAMGLQVLQTFSVRQSSFVVGAMHVPAHSELDGIQMSQLSPQTRVIAITRPDKTVNLQVRREGRLRAGDTVYLVGPYRELLNTLRKGQVPPQPSAVDHADVHAASQANMG